MIEGPTSFIDPKKHSSTQSATYRQLPFSCAQSILDVIDDAIISVDAFSKIVYLNCVASIMTGFTWQNADGCELTKIIQLQNVLNGEDLPLSTCFFQACNLQKEQSVDCMLTNKKGVKTIVEFNVFALHDVNGQESGWVIVLRDVTLKRLKAKKMVYLAEHDTLTGLPNRALFQERLKQALKLARRHGKSLAVLYLDINLFKTINDTYGHTIGDKLLTSIARRLRSAVRNSDTICRQGGDEFVILLSEIEHEKDAENFCHKLLKSLSYPHLIGGNKISVGMSIGISIFPNDGDKNETLLDKADCAMFEAKHKGSNCHRFFNINMYEHQRA